MSLFNKCGDMTKLIIGNFYEIKLKSPLMTFDPDNKFIYSFTGKLSDINKESNIIRFIIEGYNIKCGIKKSNIEYVKTIKEEK